MKILILVFILIIFLTGCQQQEPFTEIIKNDTSRIPELLRTADSVTKTLYPATGVDHNYQPIDSATLDSLRIKSGDMLTIDGRFTKVVMANSDLKKLMDKIPHSSVTDYLNDSLVFTLCALHTAGQVHLYNTQDSTAFPANTTANGILMRPVLIVHAKQRNEHDSTELDPSAPYLVGRLCPPPKPCD